MTPFRPFVGFIVEGFGEFNSYRSILSRGLSRDTRDLPINNAAGWGTLVARLEEKIEELVITWHPIHVIVTADARDAKYSCHTFKGDLQRRADCWLDAHGMDARCIPLPDTISIVIQDRAFETWLIADLEGLRLAKNDVSVEPRPPWRNVDLEEPHPADWLRERLRQDYHLKDPFLAKRLAKHIEASRMAACSRSFRKFWKEVRRAMLDAGRSY